MDASGSRMKGIVELYSKADLDKIASSIGRRVGVSCVISSTGTTGISLFVSSSDKSEVVGLYNIINPIVVEEKNKHKLSEFNAVFNDGIHQNVDSYFVSSDDPICKKSDVVRNLYYLFSLPALSFMVKTLNVKSIGQVDYKSNERLYEKLFLL